MELKDVILSTLAEMEESSAVEETLEQHQDIASTKEEKFFEPTHSTVEVHETHKQENKNSVESELMYLNSIRERLLVLFEGFQSPNNANIEAKVDMTLNFLEYTLATIDSRVQKLEKGNR